MAHSSPRRSNARPWALSLGLVALIAPLAARSAEAPPTPLTIEQAIGFALAHHPALRVQGAVEESAAARLELARTGYLPRLDAALQVNRGTGNVIRGELFGMPGVPALSGPPTPPAFDSGAFGTAVSLGASWDVVGLVQHMALVDAALQEQERTRAGMDARRLDVAFTVADLFLGLLARGESVKAVRASTERAAVFARTVKALVDQELRPGADLARAEAERALASTQLIRAEQAEAVGRLELARALGTAGQRISIVPGNLLAPPPAREPTSAKRHPVLAEADAAVATSAARKRAVDLQYLPRVELVAALWSRGTGFTSGPVPPGPAQGLVPNVPNWGAGLVVSWPALELFAVSARGRVEAATGHQEEARREELEQTLLTQVETARAILEGARRVADNTPAALQAARSAEQQAMARYQSGLAGVNEVAEAQRLLAQAELEDALARLGIRSATLLLARAVGDIEPFLADARGPEGGAR